MLDPGRLTDSLTWLDSTHANVNAKAAQVACVSVDIYNIVNQFGTFCPFEHCTRSLFLLSCIVHCVLTHLS